jgi:hypothetical protein
MRSVQGPRASWVELWVIVKIVNIPAQRGEGQFARDQRSADAVHKNRASCEQPQRPAKVSSF